MTSTPQKVSSTLVDSQYFLNRLDSLIVQLVRAIAVEQELQPDPDAKNVVRVMLQERINILLNDKDRDKIEKVYNDIKDRLRARSELTYIRNIYELIKIAGYDNVKMETTGTKSS